MDTLVPQHHAEEVAVFRHGLIGELTCRELSHGERMSVLRRLSAQRVRPPGSDDTRCFSIPTLERWLYAFRKGGLAALAPRARSDSGRGRDLAPELRELLCDIRREHPDVSVTMIVRTLRADGRAGTELTECTVRRMLAAAGLTRRAVADAPSGRTRLRWEAARPGALWHGDVCHGPTLILAGKRTPVRVHALLDDASRYVTELRVAADEREETMLSLFARAMMAHGKPDAIYLDNGSTYRGLALATACSRLRLADTAPGEVAQVDFGQMTMLADATGRLRALHALIVTMAFSRYQFVWPTFEQTTAAVCEGLDAAWRFFGAMPKVLLPDNMSAMIKQADDLGPTLVRVFLDYVQARGLLVDAARVRSPKDKARVENQVPYVRESGFDGETFRDLDDARDQLLRWCRDVAGARIHGTTCEVPRDAFEQHEKPVMKAPPTERFDVPHWLDTKVQPDHHVLVLRSLYSVPSAHLGKVVSVRADTALVRIYVGDALVKMHARVAPGKRSTDPDDYPVGKADVATRNVEGAIAEAKRAGEHVGLYAERLLAVPLPWTRSRDVFQLFLERTGRGSMIVTSNRDTAEWLAMFDDPLLAQSAIDRFKNAAFDLVVDGESYRPRLKPKLDDDASVPPGPARNKAPVPLRRKRR